MNVCKLHVSGATDARVIAQVRWELFVFPEIRDALPTLELETVAVLWEGTIADPQRWCRTLARAGYEAKPLEPAPVLDEPQPAA